MNQKAKEIGLSTTRFNNETGLDMDIHTAGAYGSAKDMAMLVTYAIQNIPELFEATRHRSVTISSEQMAHHAVNTDILVSKIPGVLASKTGFSTLAGGNLVVAYDAGLGEQYVAVVLGSSYNGRFTDIEKLIAATQKSIE
jgi:serine-type D-Ala-D-Ala carboxypeptidase (penicillin-binding protein 5/6)